MVKHDTRLFFVCFCFSLLLCAGSRFHEMLAYDLVDKITRVWLALLSKSDWEEGMRVIKEKHQALAGKDHAVKELEPRHLGKLVAAYLSSIDLRKS